MICSTNLPLNVASPLPHLHVCVFVFCCIAPLAIRVASNYFHVPLSFPQCTVLLGLLHAPPGQQVEAESVET